MDRLQPRKFLCCMQLRVGVLVRARIVLSFFELDHDAGIDALCNDPDLYRVYCSHFMAPGLPTWEAPTATDGHHRSLRAFRVMVPHMHDMRFRHSLCYSGFIPSAHGVLDYAVVPHCIEHGDWRHCVPCNFHSEYEGSGEEVPGVIQRRFESSGM